MIFKSLDERTLVTGQMLTKDIGDAVAAGVNIIVNNRPDGEEAGQPAGAEIEAAARAAGLDYRHLPIAGAISPSQVEAMAALLDDAPGRVLAFCRSGRRSAFLWALAQAERGGDGATIIAQAQAAGYDLSPIRSYLLR